MTMKVAPALLVPLAMCACAHGAIVSFTQTSPDPYNDSLLGPTTATFDVIIDDTSFADGIVRSIYMEIVAPSGPQLSFEPSPEWDVFDPPCTPLCIYFTIEAFHSWGGTPTPAFLGVLTADAAGLSAGVDHGLSAEGQLGGIEPGAQDPFATTVAIHVIPEPATLLLVACGVAVAGRRRLAA